MHGHGFCLCRQLQRIERCLFIPNLRMRHSFLHRHQLPSSRDVQQRGLQHTVRAVLHECLRGDRGLCRLYAQRGSMRRERASSAVQFEWHLAEPDRVCERESLLVW